MTLKGIRHCLIVICIVSLGIGSVSAQDAVPLLQGERAPSDGVLVSEARLKTFLQAEITVKDLEGQLRLQKRLTSNLESLYADRLQEASKEEWYQAPEFNRWLGFGIGVLVTSLAVYGASQLR